MGHEKKKRLMERREHGSVNRKENTLNKGRTGQTLNEGRKGQTLNKGRESSHSSH